MTREEAIKILEEIIDEGWLISDFEKCTAIDACEMAIKALEQEPCDDAISRQTAIDAIKKIHPVDTEYDCTLYDKVDVMYVLKDLPSVPPKRKTWHCKDCKWWKDSDGLYRRGGHAESQCPINRREVFEGNGYCFKFELRESEE